MLNKEKYAKEIIEIACNGGNIAVVNGKLENCRKTQCNECNFNGGTIRDCEIKTRKWANSEYVEPIEPPVDWSRVPVDTPILVKVTEKCTWIHRYFAKYENGLVYAWEQGATSWSAEDSDDVCDWKYAKLATNQIKKENKTMKKVMKIEGMMCGHCEARVKKVLEALDGVEQAEVSHETGTAVVEMTEEVADEVLKKAVEDQDYKVLGIDF